MFLCGLHQLWHRSLLLRGGLETLLASDYSGLCCYVLPTEEKNLHHYIRTFIQSSPQEHIILNCVDWSKAWLEGKEEVSGAVWSLNTCWGRGEHYLFTLSTHYFSPSLFPLLLAACHHLHFPSFPTFSPRSPHYFTQGFPALSSQLPLVDSPFIFWSAAVLSTPLPSIFIMQSHFSPILTLSSPTWLFLWTSVHFSTHPWSAFVQQRDFFATNILLPPRSLSLPSPLLLWLFFAWSGSSTVILFFSVGQKCKEFRWFKGLYRTFQLCIQSS